MLATMKRPDFPVAIGVIRNVAKPTYNELMEEQLIQAREQSKIHCMDDLLNSGDTWEIQ